MEPSVINPPPAAVAERVVARAPASAPARPPAAPAARNVSSTHDPLGIPDMSLVAKAGKYTLYESDGYMLANLRGGAPALFPFGGPSTDKERTISGRVTDRSGKPVAGAIVFSDRGVSIRLDTLMALAATITDADGGFMLNDAPADECFAIALAAGDWSGLVPCSDEPLELTLRGHGSLAARITYNGEPETFELHLGSPDKRFGMTYITGANGTLTIDSLPLGTYIATVGLAQSVGGGQSRTTAVQITIADRKTASLRLDLGRGTTVVVKATPPAGKVPKGITYWLFTGAVPKDGAEARMRGAREDAPSMTVGGGAKLDPVQLHDIAPGSYWACAAFFDIATMNALARPFGCKQVTIAEGDSVREVDVALVN